MQRIANPSTPVRFRPEPPKYKAISAQDKMDICVVITHCSGHALMGNVQAHRFGAVYLLGLFVG